MRAAAFVGSTVALLLTVTVSGCGQAAASPAVSSLASTSGTAVSLPAPASPSASPGSTAASSGPCTADQVSATASTDRPAYHPADTVTLSTTITNRSAQACTVVLSARNPAYSVSGSGGAEVWRSCGPGQSCPLYERAVALPAGGSRTETTPWNQQTCDASTCTGPRPPAGAYRGTATWGSLGSASATFTLG